MPSYEPVQIVDQPAPVFNQPVSIFSKPLPTANIPISTPMFSQPLPEINIPPLTPMFSQPFAEVPASSFGNIVVPSNVSPVESRIDVQPKVEEPSYNRNDPSIQEAMIQAFSQQSGMKIDWARKCLEDSEWDFEAAGRIFNQLRANIPKDAFK